MRCQAAGSGDCEVSEALTVLVMCAVIWLVLSALQLAVIGRVQHVEVVAPTARTNA